MDTGNHQSLMEALFCIASSGKRIRHMVKSQKVVPTSFVHGMEKPLWYSMAMMENHQLKIWFI